MATGVEIITGNCFSEVGKVLLEVEDVSIPATVFSAM